MFALLAIHVDPGEPDRARHDGEPLTVRDLAHDDPARR